MKINRIKLMKQLLKFGSVATDKGELYYEGEVGKDLEVFVEGEDGEMVPAEDGEYVVDKQVWVIVEGKVSEIKEVEPEEEPKPEVVEQEDEPVEPVEPTEEVKALEAKVKELEELVAAKDEEINQLKEQLKEPAAMSAKQQFKNDEARKANEIKANPALKYFQTK